VLRILSDLHFYDARAQVRDLRQLEPLLVGVRTLVSNGDSCETRHGVAADKVVYLQEFFRARVPEVVFVTGNHDPDISNTHELQLAGGRVWVTHGDVCFEDLTPWSRVQPELVRTVRSLLAAETVTNQGELETKLRIAREAARIVGTDIDPADSGLNAQLNRFLHTFFPPRQILAMLRAWRDLPALTVKLAQRHRPAAQVVVTGHVHFPSLWRRPSAPTIINTGSFFSPLGGHLVDLEGDHLMVRKIRRRAGHFEPGRLLAEISLTASQ